MDSESESSDGGKQKDKDKAASPSGPVNLDEVQTFGAFVMVTEALMRDVPNMPSEQLGALCATAVKVKYFDGDLFAEVYKVLIRRFHAHEVDFVTATRIAKDLA